MSCSSTKRKIFIQIISPHLDRTMSSVTSTPRDKACRTRNSPHFCVFVYTCMQWQAKGAAFVHAHAKGYLHDDQHGDRRRQVYAPRKRWAHAGTYSRSHSSTGGSRRPHQLTRFVVPTTWVSWRRYMHAPKHASHQAIREPRHQQKTHLWATVSRDEP